MQTKKTLFRAKNLIAPAIDEEIKQIEEGKDSIEESFISSLDDVKVENINKQMTAKDLEILKKKTLKRSN